MTKLKLLFEEYRNALRDFGVRPAPFPVSEEISEFMDWINSGFKALPGLYQVPATLLLLSQWKAF
jgi:hypothetical protein